MRYHTTEPEVQRNGIYGEFYRCDHPVYNQCTLFKIKGDERGLAVIHQYFDPVTKHTFWNVVPPYLTDQLYLNPNFLEVYNKRSGVPENGLYPTITLRQLMWALKMKPLKLKYWETSFTRQVPTSED